MLYGLDERKYYRFPSQSSILDYEMDHDIYCPSKEAIHHETNKKKDTYQQRQEETRLH